MHLQLTAIYFFPPSSGQHMAANTLVPLHTRARHHRSFFVYGESLSIVTFYSIVFSPSNHRSSVHP